MPRPMLLATAALNPICFELGLYKISSLHAMEAKLQWFSTGFASGSRLYWASYA